MEMPTPLFYILNREQQGNHIEIVFNIEGQLFQYGFKPRDMASGWMGQRVWLKEFDSRLHKGEVKGLEKGDYKFSPLLGNEENTFYFHIEKNSSSSGESSHNGNSNLSMIHASKMPVI